MGRAIIFLPLFAALCACAEESGTVPRDFASPAGGGFALLVLITGTVVCMVLLGIGLALGLAACAVTAVLAGLGIVSSSVAVAFVRRNPAAGLRVLFMQIGGAAGIPCGLGAIFFGSWLAHSDWSVLLRVAVGVGTGVAGGLVVALIFNWVWGRIAGWIVSKFKRKETAAATDAPKS